jgi:predicted DNA-binding transcriptional regulator AlpA
MAIACGAITKPVAKPHGVGLKTHDNDRPPAALAQFDRLPDSGNVRLPTVAGLCGVGPATVWRWSKEGRLPAPRKLSSKVTVWNVGELKRALAALSAEA